MNNSGLNKHIYYVLIGVEVLLAALLILPGIGRNSLWLDEVMTLHFSFDIAQFMQQTARSDPNMWLYYVLMSLWVKLGTGEAWVRLLSALFALASVPMIAAVGNRLISRKAGLIAGFLLAIHPFYIAYAREARSYAGVMFFSLLATYAFVWLLHAKEKGTKPGLAYGAVLVLGVFNHFYSALHAIAHALSLLFFPPRSWPWKNLITASLVVVVGVALMIVFVGPHSTAIITWMSAPHWATLVRTCRDLLGGGDWLIMFYAANLCAAFLMAVCSRKNRWLWGYLLLSATFPVIFSYLFAQLAMPIFQTRFLAFIVPALALLAGCVISRIKSRILMCGVLVFVCIGSVAPVKTQLTKPPRENWRGLTEHLREYGREGDVLICHARYLITPVRMYEQMRGDLPVELFDLFRVESYTYGAQDAPREETVAGLAQVHNRLWLVMGHNTFSHLGSGGQTALLMERLEKHYTMQNMTEFASIKLFLWAK